jgi:hypothetical protein
VNAFLDAVAKRGARVTPEFRLRVAARLAKGAEEYGDSAHDRPLADVVAEIREEAEDIGGWGDRAWTHPGLAALPEPRRSRVRQHLEVAGMLAALVDTELTAALIDVDQARRAR